MDIVQQPSHCCVAVSQVELGVPDSSSPNKGQVHVSVECSSCASPEFKVGQAGLTQNSAATAAAAAAALVRM
jgi:exosome complex RNA-binding protein Rrp42 (RNase PH superfamily)